jgi:hypothetical protein
MKRWPKLGTRLRVEWVDCVGYINVPLSVVKPLPCWSEGVLVRQEKDYIVLASSQYYNEANDPTGDYTAIPSVWIKNVKRL